MYADLRQFLSLLDEAGELVTLNGADPKGEIGAIYDLIEHRPGSPAVLFDQIPGYRPGYRILTNFLGSLHRIGLVLNMPNERHKLDFARRWQERIREMKATPPVLVENPPVAENVMVGSDVNLLDFPAPIWHPADGGPFIGTACCVITKDPDSDEVNLGVYRGQVFDKDTIGCFFADRSKHGLKHVEKYWKRGKPCPIAIVLGADPLLFLVAATFVQESIGEYSYAGGLSGRPVEIFKSDLTGLPLPARAELIVEGELSQDETRLEGPFGEWTGYYGNPAEVMPVVKIKRILHRNNPIVLGKPPIRPPSGWDTCKAIKTSADIWERLIAAGVPDVQGVWCHEAGAVRFFNVVSIKQRYPGHARQAGVISAQCGEGARGGRYTVVVDEDIDPSDLDQVIWAMGTRSDPAMSLDIIQRTLSSKLDPMVQPGTPYFTSRAVIDACRPYEWRDRFPAVISTPKEMLRQAEARWGDQLFRR